MSTESAAENGRLQEVIAAYLEATAAGQTPERAQLLSSHPDLADDLCAFFADHDCMNQAAAPIRDALGDVPNSTIEAFPQSFGDYELLAEIGRGGMGVVYKARQICLNRIVALKRIRAGQLASPEEGGGSQHESGNWQVARGVTKLYLQGWMRKGVGKSGCWGGNGV